ncbi:hypothetical protein ABZ532_21985 [Streptomyces sp. NPDC019396]|uniref:hypothetical protein n=1 Tax=Streptomyces sp. NPDC019396 TaxID=3154687 RepID=UPI0033CA44B2
MTDAGLSGDLALAAGGVAEGCLVAAFETHAYVLLISLRLLAVPSEENPSSAE